MIQHLAAVSTDIVVADVVKTQLRRAPEGGRDNVQLKVIQVLTGRPVSGETITVYYHLLWLDETTLTLEPRKFERGKRYVVFLRSYNLILSGGHKELHYELSDQWESVRPPRPKQLEEIAAAIRVAHGDTRGDWSAPASTFRGRLVAFRNELVNQTPVISVFLDLQSITSRGDLEFDLNRAKFTWKVTDSNGKTVAPSAPAANSPTTILDQVAVLDAGQITRLPISQTTGAEIARDKSGYISLISGKAWSFDRGDTATYFLSGTIEVPLVNDGLWYGELDLPPVEIPID